MSAQIEVACVMTQCYGCVMTQVYAVGDLVHHRAGGNRTDGTVTSIDSYGRYSVRWPNHTDRRYVTWAAYELMPATASYAPPFAIGDLVDSDIWHFSGGTVTEFRVRAIIDGGLEVHVTGGVGQGENHDGWYDMTALQAAREA